MQKTIYICLVTLFFSFSAFAYNFNEYDPGNGNYGSPYINSGAGVNDGTGFWGTNVSREVATVKAMGTNAYLYMKEPPTDNRYLDPEVDKVTDDGWEDAKSISEYEYKSGDIVEYIPVLWDHQEVVGGPVITDYKRDSSGKIQFAYIISNNNQSTFQQTSPPYTPQEVNTNMMNTFVSEATRPYFSYNFYNVNNNSFSENIYKATPTGPVIVRSTELRPYSNIPRVVKENPNFAPGSPFEIAGQILNSSTTQYSLYDGYRIIRDRLDYTAPDNVITGNNGVGLREKEILEKVLPKIREGLPADLKPDAESVLAMYLQQCDENPDIHPGLLMYEFLNSPKVDDIELPANLPFVEGKNYVFDSEGNPKEAGATGNLIQIMVNGVKKLPSELNIKDLAQRKALSKVAVFFAKKLKAPVGTILSSGTSSTDPKSIAYTEGRAPHTIRFNYKSGTFSKALDNIYNFTNVIAHELFHRANFTATPKVTSNLSNHIDVYLKQMTHTSFNKTTDIDGNDYKLGTIRSMAVYILNMDKKRKPDNTFKYSKIDIKDKMDTFNNLNLHYKLVYPVPDWKQGSLTIQIKDTNNPIKTPEDANESYYTINED